MNINTLLSHINQFVTMDAAEAEYLNSLLITRPYRQGEIIVKAGEPARYLMYVNTGYVMTYFTDNDGDDHVIQFAAEGWWAGDLFSLSHQPNTQYTTRGMCDGELLLLPRLAQQQLFEDHIKIEHYFRVLFQNSVIRHQMRFVQSYATTAEQRYLAFVETYPAMEQYVPQKYIASYLGITPEFLSKIRKNMARKAS